MKDDKNPSHIASDTENSSNIESAINSPLKACIEAQAMAAQTSWQFIKDVGLNAETHSSKRDAVYESFKFTKNGHTPKG